MYQLMNSPSFQDLLLDFRKMHFLTFILGRDNEEQVRKSAPFGDIVYSNCEQWQLARASGCCEYLIMFLIRGHHT